MIGQTLLDIDYILDSEYDIWWHEKEDNNIEYNKRYWYWSSRYFETTHPKC